MKRKILLKSISASLLIGIVIATVPAFASSQQETASGQDIVPETVEIVRVKKDIPKGSYITQSMLELVSVKNVNLPDNIVTDIKEVKAKYAATDMYAGNYIYDKQISDDGVVKASKELLKQKELASKNDFVVVTDYVPANTGEDLGSHLQELINKNKGRTLYFPDGEYLISSSLRTQSAGPYSTTFFLSDNAVIKATDDWRETNDNKALICIGGLAKANDNTTNGSYYGVIGGIFDGNGKADGISVDCSRETFIYDVCIKNTVNGIMIRDGANGHSSDADIENVTIIGNGNVGTVGIYAVGYDNTFTDIKIYDVEIGFKTKSAGSAYRNISIYNTKKQGNYLRTMGFQIDPGTDGFFYDCYTENIATAFNSTGSRESVIDGMNARWTYDAPKQVAFRFGSFNSKITNSRVDFCGSTGERAFLSTAAVNGGKIDTPILDTKLETSAQYKECVIGGLIDLSEQ